MKVSTEVIGVLMIAIGLFYTVFFLLSLYRICKMRSAFKEDYKRFEKKRTKDEGIQTTMGPRYFETYRSTTTGDFNIYD